MHVDTKYSTPETCVNSTYITATCSLLLSASKYIANNRCP